MFSVLFEDEYFIAAAKPAGIPSQATVDKGRPDFFRGLKDQLRKERDEEFYLALHHRLDRDTSGIMIFAKSKEANTPLANLFKDHLIQKTYLCFTQKKKKLQEFWTVENFLAEKKDSKLKKMKMIPVTSGGDKAITDFQCLEVYKESLLIQARPRTGRMHQIRVHLSELGMGIYGDDIYPCSKKVPAPRLMLHAFSLEFIHPFTQKNIFIECPLPEDMQKFAAQLSN